MTSRLREQYNNEIKGELLKELQCNPMEIPQLEKVVVNMGMGAAVDNSAILNDGVEILTKITGQKPMITKAKKAIAGFKLREGAEIGVAVTLRGDRMWDFFDKLINVVLPRTKDFQGFSAKAFDNAGNYSLGIREHTIFPEIDPNKVQAIRGLQVTFVLRSRNSEDSKLLLDKFGFPFRRNVNKR